MGLVSAHVFSRPDIQPSNATSFSMSVTVPSGSGRRLVAGVVIGKFTLPLITSVTFNGDALTATGYDSTGAGQQQVINAWYIDDPDVGTFNLVASDSSAHNSGCWFVFVLDNIVSGAFADAEFDFNEAGTHAGVTISPTPDATDLLMLVATGQNSSTVDGGTTSVAMTQNIELAITPKAAGAYKVGGSPGVTWSTSGQMCGLTIRQAFSAGGGPAALGRSLLLGVG